MKLVLKRILISICILNFSSYLHADLICEWNFNNNLNDSKGVNNGKAIGPIEWVAGKSNAPESALKLRGKGYIDFGNKPDFAFGNGNKDKAFSIEWWQRSDIRPGLGKGGKGFVVLYKKNEFLVSWKNAFRLELYSGSIKNRIGRVAPSLNIKQRKWTHIVVSYDGSGKSDGIKFYQDSKLVKSTAYVRGNYRAMKNSGNPLCLGLFRINRIMFYGAIDCLKIYNHVLTASEVKKKYLENNKSTEALKSWKTRFAKTASEFNEDDYIAGSKTKFSFDSSLNGWETNGKNRSIIKPLIDIKEVFKGKGSLLFKSEGKKRKLELSNIFNTMHKSEIYRLSVWVKKSNINDKLPIDFSVMGFETKESYINKTPTIFYYKQNTGINRNGWNKISFTFQIPKNYWRMLTKIVIEANSKGNKIWFDHITIERLYKKNSGIKLRRFYSSGQQGLFKNNQKPELIFSTINTYDSPQNISYKFIVRDFYNKIIYEKEKSIKLEKLKFATRKIKLPLIEKYGFYSVNIKFKNNNKVFKESLSSFCIIPQKMPGDQFFGMNGSYPCEAETARMIGVGRAEVRFEWKSITPSPGVYKWRKTDKLVKSYIGNNIKITGMLDTAHYRSSHTPNWILNKVNKTGELGSEYFKAWSDFVSAVATRYKNKIKVWDLREELNISVYESKICGDSYKGKVKSAYPILKKIDPESVIGGVCISGRRHLPLAAKYWNSLNKYLDGMFSDPYLDKRTFGPGLEISTPEDSLFRDTLIKMTKIIAKNKKNKVFISEQGNAIKYSLPVDSEYAKERAKIIARSFIIAKSIPEVGSYQWFYMLGPQNGIEAGRDYGLWKNLEGFKYVIPRPSLAAYISLANILAETTSPEEINIHENIYCYVFRKCSNESGGGIAALWNTEKNSVIFEIKTSETLQVYNLMGNLIKNLPPGKCKLLISEEPVFLFSKTNMDKFCQILKNASYSLDSLKADISLYNQNHIAVSVFNHSSKSINGSISIKEASDKISLGKNSKFTIDSNAKKLVKFELDNPKLAELNKKEFTAKIKYGENSLELKKQLNLFPIYKMNKKVKIDGDISEFTKFMVFTLDSYKQLNPPDAKIFKHWTGNKDLSCKVYMAYDKKYLYFAAEVNDDIHSNKNSDYRIYNGDCFQIAFDTLNDAVPLGVGKNYRYDKNDYEYGIALTEKGVVTFCWQAGIQGTAARNSVVKFPATIVRKENKTFYELAIPWTGLAPLSPAKGTVFGFNAVLLDNDKKNGNSLYGLQLSDGIYGNKGKNPSCFKTFVLCGQSLPK